MKIQKSRYPIPAEENNVFVDKVGLNPYIITLGQDKEPNFLVCHDCSKSLSLDKPKEIVKIIHNCSKFNRLFILLDFKTWGLFVSKDGFWLEE